MFESCSGVQFCQYSWKTKWICVEDKVAGIVKHYLDEYLEQEKEKLVLVIIGPDLQRDVESENSSSPRDRKLFRNHILG